MIHLRRYLNILIGISCVGMLAATHAFYISLIDIQYFPEEQKLDIQYKIFTDDLESGIRAWEDKPISLREGISLEERERIQKFLQAKTHIQFNNKDPELSLVSCTNEGDATFIVSSGVFSEKPTVLEIHCSLLIDIFPNQRNVVRYKEGTNQKMLTLGKGTKKGEVTLGK